MTLTSRDGDRFWRLPEVIIRGNNIKYLRIPEEVIDMVPEEDLNAKGAACTSHTQPRLFAPLPSRPRPHLVSTFSPFLTGAGGKGKGGGRSGGRGGKGEGGKGGGRGGEGRGGGGGGGGGKGRGSGRAAGRGGRGGY